MGNLLFDEPPLVVLPLLAKKIGLNESIILQQVHYWIKVSTKEYEGKKWTYNSYDEWLLQFPFWSKSTLRRSIASLEEKGLLITGNFNKMKADKTKWYTIDYSKLEGLSSPCVQNEQTVCSKWTDPCVQNEPSNTLDLPKTSTKTSTIPYVEIVQYMNEKCSSGYKPSSKRTKQLIKARWSEENTLDDFKKVIDNKVNEWTGTKYEIYLRPETLFGPKFESYLNQKGAQISGKNTELDALKQKYNFDQ